MGDIIDTFDIDLAESSPMMTPIQSMIKVIGVGGGGCNAVNYMFRERWKVAVSLSATLTVRHLMEAPSL